MARTSRQERNTTILGILQLLLKIHPWVRTSYQTTDGANKKKGMEVTRRRKECL